MLNGLVRRQYFIYAVFFFWCMFVQRVTAACDEQQIDPGSRLHMAIMQKNPALVACFLKAGDGVTQEIIKLLTDFPGNTGISFFYQVLSHVQEYMHTFKSMEVCILAHGALQRISFHRERLFEYVHNQEGLLDKRIMEHFCRRLRTAEFAGKALCNKEKENTTDNGEDLKERAFDDICNTTKFSLEAIASYRGHLYEYLQSKQGKENKRAIDMLCDILAQVSLGTVSLTPQPSERADAAERRVRLQVDERHSVTQFVLPEYGAEENDESDPLDDIFGDVVGPFWD